MENIVCKSCGGSVTRKGNYYICDFCRSKWMIDSGNDVHAVERANAWEALRNNDFEKAAELFENIIVKDTTNHEAYWGRALALNGIVYVTDYNENKKVPTCNNITEESFLKNKDVQKAISLAPTDIKESYQKQAEQIEKIRIEWLNKASKEPAYDIFISFKDSDREHGIERTQDSIDVQDLYTALVAKGYNVFFSRVTLRDKVSEQYEPYIYNALKTAKVMIVFGEKAEYFNAVWVKNEWSRFKTRVEKGEKHKNSLITVYKGVNPYEIPVALTGGRQAIDYSIPSNYEVLMNHIKRVIEESEQAVHLDRIQIKGGQMAKKSSKIKTETLQTRELGKCAIAKTSISEKQTLDLAHSYLMGRQWEDANKLLDDLLFNNPNLADAIWYKLQAKFQVTSDAELFKKISSFVQEDYDTIARILNCAEKERATYILNSMYALCKNVSENTNLVILNTVLPFNYDEREERIAQSFVDSISSQRFTIFKLLLSTLDSKDVDTYIKYNLEFAKTTKNIHAKEACLNNVISVDEGNKEAQKMCLNLYLDRDDVKNAIKTLETILKYSSNHKKVVYDLLVQIKDALNSNEDCLVLREVIKYYPGELIEIKDLLLDVAFIMIRQGYFEHAKYLLSLILTVDENNSKIYWGLCLVKTKSRSDSEISKSDISLKQVPEYTKYLTMVDETRRQECFGIVKKQENAQQSRKSAKKFGIFSGIAVAVVAVIVAIAMIFQNVILPNNKYEEALSLLANKNYNEAYQILEELGDYKDAEEVLNGSKYSRAKDYISQNDDVSAYQLLSEITSYKDSATLVDDIQQRAKLKAGEYANNNDYESAYNTLKNVGIDEASDSTMETYKHMANGDFGEAIQAANWSEFTIPNGVVSINSYTFEDCYSLKKLTIPASVTKIGYNAFDGCYNLESIYYLGTADKWVEIDADNYGAAPMYYAENLYINGALVEDISLTTAKQISDYAFYGCKTLKSVLIGNNVTSIGEDAFYNCENLATMVIPKNVTSIESDAFYGCENLSFYCATAEKPSGWASDWNEYSYSDSCPVVWNYGGRHGNISGVSWVLTNNNNIAISGCVDGTTNLKIPATIEGYPVVEIIDEAFKNNTSINSIEIPESIVTIGEDAFYGCKNLTIYCEADSKPSMWSTSWNKYAYSSYCPVIWYYGGKQGITTDGIQWYSLKDGTARVIGCTKTTATQITIPSKIEEFLVTEIAEGVLEDCNSLVQLTIPFVGERLDGTGYANFGFIFGETSYYSQSSYIPSSLTTVVITGGSKIAGDAFYKCSRITLLTIPDSVQTISTDAFYGCSSNLVIFCEVASQPSGWVSGWNKYAYSSYCAVYWDFGGSLGVTNDGYLWYSTNDGTATIMLYSGTNTEITVPSQIEGFNVSKLLSTSFNNNTTIEKVVLPNTITNIDEATFYNCSNLKTITLSNNLSRIGKGAFYNCSSLTSIHIPSTIVSIGSDAFYGCTSLTKVDIKDINSWATISFGDVEANPLYYAKKLYVNNSLVNNITLANNIQEVSAYSFYNCTSLQNVTIPNTVNKIGASAFAGCSALKEMTLPFIGSTTAKETGAGSNLLLGYLFGSTSFEGALSTKQYYSSSYVTYYIPASLSKINVTGVNIPYGAFYGCVGLAEINLNNIETIGDKAFYNCDGLKNLTISENVRSIGADAFYNCTQLVYNNYSNACYLGNTANEYLVLVKALNANITSSTVHDKTKIIYNSAYANCNSLLSVQVGKSVETIGDKAFYSCDNLSNISIPDSIEHVGSSAFENCDLTYTTYDNGYYLGNSTNPYVLFVKPTSSYKSSCVIHDRTKMILHYAFEYSYASEVTIGASVEIIGRYAFSNSDITSINIPAAVREIGNNAFSSCSALTAVYITNLDNWCSIKFANATANPLYYAKNLYVNNLLIQELTIDTVQKINDYAFYNCENITSIKISGTVKEIGISAFYGCVKVTNIELSGQVQKINDNAFSGCNRCVKITIPTSVEYIGQNVFSNCDSLTIYCKAESKPQNWSEDWNLCKKDTYYPYTTTYCLVVWGA